MRGHGKKVAKLRQDSIVPGVVYGNGARQCQAPLNILAKVINLAGKNNGLYRRAGKKRVALVKDVTRDPSNTSSGTWHSRCQSDEKVVAEVPVHLIGLGESLERSGLVILRTLEKLDVRATSHLPESQKRYYQAEAHEQVMVSDT
jgi:ribosomal protein L25 (general stress protein Ctc)